MARRVVLVTGASRGIGLGLVRELLRVGDFQVVATCRCFSFLLGKNNADGMDILFKRNKSSLKTNQPLFFRNPSKADELRDLLASASQQPPLPLDVANDESIRNLTQSLKVRAEL